MKDRDETHERLSTLAEVLTSFKSQQKANEVASALLYAYVAIIFTFLDLLF